MVSRSLVGSLFLPLLFASPQACCEDSPQKLEAERITLAIENGQEDAETLLLAALDNRDSPMIGIGAIQRFALDKYGLGIRECGWSIPELSLPSVYQRLEELAFELPSDSKEAIESAMALSFIRETPQDEIRYFERLKREPDWMFQGVWLSNLMTNGLCDQSILVAVARELLATDPPLWAIELGKRVAKEGQDPEALLLDPLFALVTSEQHFLDFELLWAINAYQPLSEQIEIQLSELQEAMRTGEVKISDSENYEATMYALDQILATN